MFADQKSVDILGIQGMKKRQNLTCFNQLSLWIIRRLSPSPSLGLAVELSSRSPILSSSRFNSLLHLYVDSLSADFFHFPKFYMNLSQD